MAGLVLLLVAVGGFFLLRDDGTQIIPAEESNSGSTDAAAAREDAAADLLGRLQDGLASGPRREVLALAVGGGKAATAKISAIFDNVRRLGLTDLSFRYIDENQGQAVAEGSGDGATDGLTDWVAEVQVAWRIAGFDRVASQMEVPIAFARTHRGAAFVSVGADPSEAAPLWLLDRVAVERSRRTLVMAVDRSRLEEYSALSTRAVDDVSQVLPGWPGRLVVEVPESEQRLEQMVGAETNAYHSIAAVTSTVDGSADPAAPTHILVNPTVFGRLSKAGAQIVMSHEATHVATDAALSTTPMWLLEGFADYVAIDDVELPVSVTASQILAKVRRGGPPKQLPRARDFDPANTALGTSYEAAWLACRLIDGKYGEQRLIDFYEAVDGGQALGVAFRQVLDTDKATFVSAWQDHLTRLAG